MPRRVVSSLPAARWRFSLRLGGVLLLAAVLPPAFSAPRPAPAVEAGSVRFTRSYGWLPVDVRRLVLWAGVEEPYLVDLAPGCGDLRLARVSGLTTHNRRLSPRTDSLMVDGAACPVAHVQPAAGSTLAGLGLRREDARPLPIVPVPPSPLATPSPRKTP